MNEVALSLMGVVIGYMLSEGTSQIKNWRSEKRMRTSLINEVRSNLRMIPSKKDILSQAHEHFINARVMPTQATHFSRQIYDLVIQDFSNIIKDNERDCLHVLYENLRIIDDAMDSIETRFITISSTHSIDQSLSASASQIQDLLNAMSCASNLANSLLNEKPIDVYKFGNKN